jgi:hypothetical protein
MAAAHQIVPPSRPTRRRVKPSEPRVIPLPVQPRTSSAQSPWWLRSLLLMQRTSTVVAFGLIGSTLLVYAMTVYSQQLWNRQYRQLENLQRHKRDLIATHETLKHQLAQEALQSKNQLVNPEPSHTIFLPTTGQPSFHEPTAVPSSQKSFSQAPIGY